MLELARKEYASLTPLLTGLLSGTEVLGAVLAGHTTGRVFVPNDVDRRTAFAHVNGFCVIAGEIPDQKFAQDCVAWLNRPGNEFFILHPGSPDWVGVLEKAVDAGTKKLQRAGFAFDGNAFRERSTAQVRVTDCELVAMDGALMRKAAQKIDPWIAGTWCSVEAFEAQGIGVCAVVDGQIASLCYSIFVSGVRHEIDILTVKEFRSRGLARSVASAFIERCLAGAVEPVWNCYRSNTASYRLAQSLGFKPATEFAVFAR